MFNLEVWCSHKINGQMTAVKVNVLLDHQPDEREIHKARADAEATWRRWFIIGKGIEKPVGKDPMPAIISPSNTGHKVIPK
jgi:uncharacterized protein YgfB (UPF0149 family)